MQEHKKWIRLMVVLFVGMFLLVGSGGGGGGGNTTVVEPTQQNDAMKTQVTDKSLTIVEPSSNLNNLTLTKVDESLDVAKVEVRTLQSNEVLAIPSHIQQLSDIFQFSNIDNKNAIMETPVAISNTEELQEARLYRYNKEHNFWDTTVLDTEFDEASSTIKVNLSELNQVPFFIGKIQGKGTGLSLEDLNNIPSMPLAPTAKFNRANLPNSYDLSSHMPPVRSQGSQGSCVGWATGYYLKSYHEHIENQTTYGVGDDYSNVYSPAFIYNAIKVSDCQSGSYFEDALSRLQNVGISSWNDMPYSETHCDAQPSSVAIDNAKCAKITSYQYFYSKGYHSFNTDIFKNYLVNNQPIVIGVTVYNGFDGQYSRLANKEYNAPLHQDHF